MTTTQIDLNKKLKLHYSLLVLACITASVSTVLLTVHEPLAKWLLTGIFLGLLSATPLLTFSLAVFKPTTYSLSWYSFILLAYLTWGIYRAFLPNGLIGGLLICAFSVTSILYVIMWLKPLKKIAKQKKKDLEEKLNKENEV